MEKITGLLATYNKKVNEKLISLLEQLSESQIRMENKTYFHSILMTFVHLINSNFNWIKRFNDSFPEKKILDKTEILSIQTDLDSIKENYKKAYLVCKKIDLFLEKYIHSFTENELDKIIKYKNYKGEDTEKILWHVIMQALNHETHHRGVISAALDELGVENDFSGIFNYF
jgi:uncharacterized damage-inducible protein DinB